MSAMKKNIDPKKLRLPLILTAVIMGLYCAVKGFEFSFLCFLDGLTISAIVLMLVGLVRVVSNSGFFTTTAFGMNKLVEVIKTKDYKRDEARYNDRSEYAKDHNSYHSPTIFLAVSLAEFCLCFFLSTMV